MTKRLLGYFKQCKDLLSNLNKKEKISMPFLWLDSLWSLLYHGCLIKQYTHGEFYKIARPLRKNVVTQKRVEKLIRDYNNKKYIHYLKNKNEFNEFFKEWVKRDWLWSKDMELGQFELLVKKHNRLFIKPLDDQEGHGIRVIEVTDDNQLPQLYNELKQGNTIIEEAIKQHPMMKFNNSSVNTVRIITCVDSKGVAHIVRAALRVGIGNAIVDNYTAGGALYDVDIQTGIIDYKGIGHDGETHIFHPGTNICMLGFKIPNWEIVKEGVCKAAIKIRQCRFVGWDVAITSYGIELIEGNHNPGLFTMESVGKPCAYKDILHSLNM